MKTASKRMTAGMFMLTALSLSRPSALRAADFHLIKDVISATVDLDFFSAYGLIEGPEVGFESLPPYNRIGVTTWVTNDPYGFPSNYFEPLPDPAPRLVFDLGADVPVTEISVWGYAIGVEGNSLKEFSLRFATDSEGPDGAGGSITYNPTYIAGPQISPRQSFLLGQKITARYVEMTPLSNNIGLGPGGDRVGFGEVAFEILPSVTGSYVELQSELAIGSASTVRQFTIQVKNLGPQPLSLTNPVFTGTGAAAFSVLNLPASVPAYTISVISLQFNPVGLSAGATEATFSVNTNTVGVPKVESALTASVPDESADLFYPITGATSATSATDYFPVANLIGGPGIGFDAEQPHAQPTTAALWVTNAPNGGDGDYFAPVPDPAPSLIIDLGLDVKLGEISVWGYASGNANGASDFNVRFATSAEGAAGLGTSIPYKPKFIAAFGATDRQEFDFSQVVTARYVEIVPTDNYFGGTSPGGDRVGFGDIAFEKITTVTGRNLIFPNTLDIGVTDKSKTASFVLKNYGTEAVTISSITLDGAAAAAFTVKSAPATLPPVSQSVVELQFNSASATLGPVEAFVRVASNDPANPSAVILIGGQFVSFPDEFYPVASIASNTSGTDLYPATNVIQGIGIGFSDTQPHPQITDSATWVTDAPNGTVNYFNPTPEPAPLLLFDLGEDLPLSEVSIWGYAATNSNGLRDFSLTFATAAEGPYGNSSITYEPTFTVELGNVDRNSFHFDRMVTAAYVMLTPINNWGADSGIPGGDRVGIGEVAFQKGAALAVPLGGFAISSVSRNALGQVTLSFGAEEGSNYTVYRSTDLKNWSPVSDPLTGVTGIMDFTDNSKLPAATTAIFYRVSRTTPQ